MFYDLGTELFSPRKSFYIITIIINEPNIKKINLETKSDKQVDYISSELIRKYPIKMDEKILKSIWNYSIESLPQTLVFKSLYLCNH